MRPVFELICGHCSLRERALAVLNVSDWGALARNHLADSYREQHPDAHVNDFTWLRQAPTLLINARWLPTAEALNNIREDEVGLIDETVVFLTLDPLAAQLFTGTSWDEALADVVRNRRPVPTEGALIQHPWDLVNHNRTQLAADFHCRRLAGTNSPDLGPQVAVLGRPEDVYVSSCATVDPFTVLDARQGPVFVDREAAIGSFTHLEGPCYVGPGSQLFRAHVRAATTIGAQCRVGGEVEESILHGYVNSYHDGFLGHAYVCPWVNLGALTTNSDLKNDYSSVRVPLAGEMIETGSTKVGCFIGDHTKTALGSLFNTGSSIGVMCMVLPAGGLLPKHIPSFSRIWQGELDDGLDLDDGLRTAQVTMGRRGCQLSGAQERLIRFLFDENKGERDKAIARFREKRLGKVRRPLSVVSCKDHGQRTTDKPAG